MSATSQPTDFSDLFTDLQNRVRVATAVTATENQAKRYINVALHDLHLGFDYRFPWAERSARLIVRASYTTGTVSISKGSQTLTGVSTAWTTADDFAIANARANGKILISGSRVPYVVDAVGSATSITLSSRFTEATVAAGSSYTYFEDEYALASDFLRPVDAQTFSDEVSIDLISRTEFRRRFPNNVTLGRPKTACIVDAAPSGNTTPIRRVKLNPPSSTAMTVPYTYITSNLATNSAGVAQANLSANADEPIVPLRYRHAIVFHALYHWYRDKRDDVRSGEAKGEYTDIMLRIGADAEAGGVRPRFRPQVTPYARSAKRPWSGSGGRRFDINGRFDRME